MYCPNCAARLADTAIRCHQCDLDVQGIAMLLRQNDGNAQYEVLHAKAACSRHWKQQRHGIGLLLIMSSFLVGCLIPLTMGLFLEFAARNTLILMFAGLAGVLFVLGTMLILASEGTILTSADGSHTSRADHASPPQNAAHTGPTTPLLGDYMTVHGVQHGDSAPQLANR